MAASLVSSLTFEGRYIISAIVSYPVGIGQQATDYFYRYTESVSDFVAPGQSTTGDADRVARRDGAGAGASGLGTTTKSVDARIGEDALSCLTRGEEQRQGRRSARWRLMARAGALLPDERVSGCMRCGSSGLDLVHDADRGIASYRGLQACGSIWMCPVCSAKVSECRRGELNYMLAWGREQGFKPVLLTLTMRHGRGDDLASVLQGLVSAKKRLHQSRAWRSMAKAHVIGHVTALEVTHGDAGWHPHYHVLLMLAASSEAEAIQFVEGTFDAWRHALSKEGFDCNEYGHKVQGAADAGDYVSKWGAAEELVLTGPKQARSNKGRSPWRLLHDYDLGDNQAGALFVEYAEVFKGRRQLIWSRGLKDLIELEDFTDQEVAQWEEEGDWTHVAHIEPALWYEIVRREEQSFLLDIVERWGGEAVESYLAAIRAQMAERRRAGRAVTIRESQK